MVESGSGEAFKVVFLWLLARSSRELSKCCFWRGVPESDLPGLEEGVVSGESVGSEIF